MEQKKNASAAKKGMNRSTHPSQLEPTEYTFMLNGNIESEHGERLNVTNEPSNYLAVEFPEGYKVVGFKKHPVLPRTYYFLTNPITGYSSFGYVDNDLSTLTFAEDTNQECDNCEYYNLMPDPLEETEQTPYNQYIELLNDLCNKDLNLNINHPIKHIEIKVGKLGTLLYFVDAYNPDRWINVDDIDYYKFEGVDVCGDDNTSAICVNVEKMLQEPNYSIPIITPELIQIGGNLRMGNYQFILAYCDKAGNEITQYHSITQPINIFDENNRVLEQTELDSFTNFAIKLRVDNLDTDFKYYKVVVIERVSVNQAEGYFEEGIHPTTDNTILYTSTQTGTENIGGITKRINSEKVMAQKVRYEHSRGIEVSNKQMFKYGLIGKKFPNLQPIVNLIGGFLKWNSSVAKEDLYKDPIATSLYKGYMREETQPFGLRFFTKNGMEYPVTPLVARPAKIEELEFIDTDDKNLQSVIANNTECTSANRSRRWQLFNTATVGGTCDDYTLRGQTVEETETSTCIVKDVAELEDSSVAVDTTDLLTYINSNLSDIIDPDSDKYLPTIATYLEDEYPDDNCVPSFSTECGDYELSTEYVRVQQITNEVLSTTYNENSSTYPKNVPPTECQPYQTDAGGDLIEDTDFQTNYGLTTVYKRQGTFTNEVCLNAFTVLDNNDYNTPTLGYYHNYSGADTAAELTNTDIDISVTNANFLANLHTNTLWFKVNKNNRKKIAFEITKNSACTTTDDTSSIQQLRYSFFTSCAATEPIYTEIISTATGDFQIVDVSTYPTQFYVAVEAPIVETPNDKFIIAPPCGCFSVLTRSLEETGKQVSFDSMLFEKVQTYEATCTYKLPEINDCFPISYQYGDFSYVESTDAYPDNEELYDSSKLLIGDEDLTGLSAEQKQQFRDYYTNGTSFGVYNLKQATNLACQPIRHYKFPSNIISPFMGTDSIAPFAEGLIFPLGVSLDNNVVNTFLDIAVKNKLLTQEQRNEIEGYEIVKGDNTLHKSIVANTVGFDMYKYIEKGQPVLYPNYPLNDLGDDLLHMNFGNNISHPFNGASNYNFSLLSPDLSLNKPTIPSEIILSGYQFGNSRMFFQDVEDYPKYVVLTQTAKNVASTLAVLEFASEIAIKIADYTMQGGMQWSIAGATTGSWAGQTTGTLNGYIAGGNAALAAAGTSIALVAALAVGDGITKIGQYRLQWLQTFENFGQPKNHSSYCVAEGFHNKFLSNTSNSDLVRGISASKYLKAGRYTFKDEHTGETIKINNKDREYSTFISLGEDYDIAYPAQYAQYDNNTLSTTNGSRTILSENDGQQGEEIVRNTALPYITLKNYIPNQFGTIDSVKWLTTSYKKLLVENTQCEVIFGGTVYLCRDIQKRKVPIFRANAFGQADMTPFSLSEQKNIGTPRYYLDYKTGDAGTLGDFLFPDLNSDYTFDNETDNGLYFRSGSKFYLYYYGFASYLVETEINTNYRYGRRDIKDQYYPDIQGDMVEYTQEKNLSIKEPVTYYYNSVYSRTVTQTPFYTFPATYSKAIYDKLNDAENGYIYSLPDNSENDLTDPWLIFLPLNRAEFGYEYGKLISLEGLESETLLARFENGEVLLNAVDKIANQNSAITVELGTGGIDAKRTLEPPKSEVGNAGTQNTEYLMTPFGNYSVDAKRGQIFQRRGQEITPVSDYIGQNESGLKNWLKQQLPFKILKYFPNADIDNKFKGLGITMGLDNKLGRVLITKKDYIPKNIECLQWDEELGIVLNDTLCGQEPEITCPIGYEYNESTQLCEKIIYTDACPDGYTYNSVTGKCDSISEENYICADGCEYVNGKCECGEDNFTPLPCGEGCIIVIQPNGNALCVCPSQEIDSQCDGCDVDVEFTTCPEGYTYDDDLQKCVKIIAACPPYEGYFAGGVFTNPSNRIYNSENDLLDLFNGSVNVFHRDKTGYIYAGGGFSNTSEGTINRLIRLNFDGSIDETFDIGTGFNGEVDGIDSYTDGRIIVVGSFTTYQGQPARGIIRLNNNGSKDTSFDNSVGFSSTDQIQAVRIVEDGKILVGSTRANTYKGTTVKGVIKLLNNGSVDSTFDGGDRFNSFVNDDTATGFNGVGNLNGAISSIEITPTGEYLLGGTFNEYNGVLSRRIVKIKPNGDIDLSFNAGVGFVPNPTSTATWHIGTLINKIQMQGNKILAAGQFFLYKGQPAQGIVRLNPNGSLDNTFNNNKNLGTLQQRVIWDFDTNVDGEILIGGQYGEYDSNGIANLTYTDINGFSLPTPNEMFNNVIFSVLNTPKCEVCYDDNCVQMPLGFGQVQCQCPPLASEPTCVCTEQVTPTIIDTLTPVDYDNEDYFEDASWTVAFKPNAGYLSHMDYKPDYYVSYDTYFQAGYNYSQDKGTLWTHLMNNRSFQVFQGRKYPFIIELPVTEGIQNRYLNSLSLNVEAKHYSNDYDYAENSKIGFSNAIIYNHNNNSGSLKLNLQETLRDIRNYPQTNGNTQSILFTSLDNKHSFNYFYNRVKNQNNNVPQFIWDNVMINKAVNPQAVSFGGKRVLERLRGDYFLLRLTYNTDSRYQIIFKNTINSTTNYE